MEYGVRVPAWEAALECQPVLRQIISLTWVVDGVHGVEERLRVILGAPQYSQESWHTSAPLQCLGTRLTKDSTSSSHRGALCAQQQGRAHPTIPQMGSLRLNKAVQAGLTPRSLLILT